MLARRRLGYVVSLAVVAFVIGLAWLASRDDPAPAWWDRYASPAILWISPVAFVLLVWRYVGRLRRKGEGPSGRSRPAPLDKEEPQ